MKLTAIRLLLFLIAFLIIFLTTGSMGLIAWVIALAVTYVLDPLFSEVL